MEFKKDEMQMSFFNLDDPLLEEIKEEILSLDINKYNLC
jgi:DNA mismatch repair protein MutS